MDRAADIQTLLPPLGSRQMRSAVALLWLVSQIECRRWLPQSEARLRAARLITSLSTAARPLQLPRSVITAITKFEVIIFFSFNYAGQIRGICWVHRADVVERCVVSLDGQPREKSNVSIRPNDRNSNRRVHCCASKPVFESRTQHNVSQNRGGLRELDFIPPPPPNVGWTAPHRSAAVPNRYQSWTK